MPKKQSVIVQVSVPPALKKKLEKLQASVGFPSLSSYCRKVLAAHADKAK